MARAKEDRVWIAHGIGEKMKILMTGGAGYVGTELAHVLNQDPKNQLTILDDLSRTNFNFFIKEPFPHPENISFVRGTIFDSRNLSELLKGTDTVFN